MGKGWSLSGKGLTYAEYLAKLRTRIEQTFEDKRRTLLSDLILADVDPHQIEAIARQTELQALVDLDRVMADLKAQMDAVLQGAA